MNARSLLFACASALLLVACGGGGPSTHPDAGNVCDPNEERFLIVTVVDASGAPAAGATVTARNDATGKVVTALTNDQGISSAVGSTIGSGTVMVSATLASKASNTQQAEFSCGECGCNIEPGSVTITLNP